MTRRSVSLCVLVMVVLTAGTLGVVRAAHAAAANMSAAPFVARLVVPSFTSATGPSGDYFAVGHDPFSTSIPVVGRTSVSGELFRCNSAYYPPGTGCDVDTTSLQFYFETPSGARLVLAGSGQASVPVPWSVAGGTGRFARASGSGVFTYEVDAGNQVLTLVFSGSLRLS